MRLAVIIPAYNAARHLHAVVDRVVAAAPGLERIVIVNDGSRDNTARVADEIAGIKARVTVIHRPVNGGYGAAVKDGLRAGIECKAETIACVHADGQYSPEILPQLLEQMSRRGLDLLQGSRVAPGTALAGGMPLYKYLGNSLLNVIENRVLRLAMTDYHSGYLIYGARALDRLPFARLSNSFDFDLEVIAAARAHGLAIGEAPIPTHYGDEVSHLNPFTYGLRVLRVMWRFQRGQYAPQ